LSEVPSGQWFCPACEREFDDDVGLEEAGRRTGSEEQGSKKNRVSKRKGIDEEEDKTQPTVQDKAKRAKVSKK